MRAELDVHAGAAEEMLTHIAAPLARLRATSGNAAQNTLPIFVQIVVILSFNI